MVVHNIPNLPILSRSHKKNPEERISNKGGNKDSEDVEAGSQREVLSMKKASIAILPSLTLYFWQCCS